MSRLPPDAWSVTLLDLSELALGTGGGDLTCSDAEADWGTTKFPLLLNSSDLQDKKNPLKPDDLSLINKLC